MARVNSLNKVIAIFIAGTTGSMLKILGGILYGSNTLFVDALTSIANMIALLVVIWSRRVTTIPPDLDHHFGHERFEYIGILVMIVTYGFVAGISITRLYYVREYSVELDAFYLAVAAILVYSIAIFLSRSAPPSIRAYGAFTISEVLEGVVSIIASLGGALYSYLVDYGGAVLLTSYIFYEIYEEGRNLASFMADEAPPLSIYEKVVGIAESEGFLVKSIRLRTIVPGKYHGDIVLSPGSTRYENLKNLKKKLSENGVDVCIEVSSP
jgi:divalent metal cation (Fe/Co/Zn/Cd) transporter